MPRIASLAIDFTTNVASIANDMSKVQKSVTGTLQNIRNVAATAFATFIPAATINQALNMGGALQDLKQQTGFAAESLQSLRAVAGQNTVSAGEFDDAISKLNTTIGQAREGSKSARDDFARVGITLNDLATLSPEQIFTKMQDGFAGITNGSDRATIAAGLFGKAAGPGMAVLMGQGSSAIAAQRKQLEDLGVFMSNDLVASTASANDALATSGSVMQTSFNTGFLTQVQDKFSLIGQSMTTTASISRDVGEVFGYIASEAIGLGAEIAKLVGGIAQWAGGMETVKMVSMTAINVIKLGLLGLQDILVTYTGALAKMLQAVDHGLTDLLNKLPESMGGGGFTYSNFLDDMAQGSALASQEIRKNMEAIATDTDMAIGKWKSFMANGKSPELAQQLDILNSAQKNLATGAQEVVKVPIDTHIASIGREAKKSKTEMDKLGDAVGDVMQNMIRDIASGDFSLKSLGNSIASLAGKLFESQGFQQSSANFFSSAFSGIGNFFSRMFGSLPSFDAGTNYVQKSGLAMIHEGEEIRPARANRGWQGGDGGGVVVNVNNYGGGQVTQRTSRRNGQTNIDIDFDRMMATKLRDPGSYTGNATGMNPLKKR